MTFHPHFLIVNWGHHHTYFSNTRGGEEAYRDIVSTFQYLRNNGGNSTRFLFKTTAPVCDAEIRNEVTNIVVHCLLRKTNPYDPTLLCNRLIKEGYFERYNIFEQIAYLGNKTVPPEAVTNRSMYNETFPIYWDAIHPHCWVMTELNRVFLATYFTSSKWRKGAS